MQPYQKAFIQLAIDNQVLRFGEFTLKSGRVSPYFFNLGQIASGAAMATLADAYVDALEADGIEFDMLFGPAYKGIPLVAALATAYARRGRDLPFAYNRKEAKDHGEGGTLVGAAPAGRVLIVDDVLTAGTALRQSIKLLRTAGAEPVGAAIALDRQERGPNGRSAVQEIEQEAGLKIVPLVTAREVLQFISEGSADTETVAAMRRYQENYGIAD